MLSVGQGYTIVLNRASLAATATRTRGGPRNWFASLDSRMSYQRLDLDLVTAEDGG